jgi:predicted cupin superfamily sugar epimerase
LKGARFAITTIYFLLVRGQKSVFHRVLSDEIWHFYQGAPLRLWRVSADFGAREAFTLGTVDAAAAKPSQGRGTGRGGKAMPVAVIPREEWQAAETLGDHTLVGCSVGPGFDFGDFTLLRDDAKAAERMRRAFPDLAPLI